jgi:CheY-like chemotaxis protein
MSDRKEERVLITKDVVINSKLKARTIDISKGGMYIYTQEEFIKGDIIDLSFDVDDRTIKVKAQVSHLQPGMGIGVKFIGLSSEDSISIKKLVGELQNVFPSDISEKKKVLIIDDDVKYKSVYKTRLLRDGFAVTDASSGSEALNLLKHSMPDVIVLNLLLESKDGFEILQWMHTNMDLKMIPVLILSATSVPAEVEKAAALGVRDFLLKMTTTPVKLSERIKELLGVR